MNFSSKLLENAVEQMSSLPGVGKKTAFRLVLHLLKQDAETIEKFSHSFIALKKDIKYCKHCYNISDNEICEICNNPNRNEKIVCVVEDIRDVIAIENTLQYKGKYHILGGIISPMNGIGPSDINVEALVERVKNQNIEEIILALSATIEGDTTNFYISKKLKDLDVKISIIARGVAIGNELEYVDEVTLGRSIEGRIPYENSFSR